MRSRFLARLTDIAFQASPPRGVGMLRLVSPSAISRYGLPRIASRTGFPRQKRMGVQAAARLESHVIQITMNASESPTKMEIGITGGIFFSLQPRQQRASDDGTTRQRSVSSRFSIMTVKRCKLAPRQSSILEQPMVAVLFEVVAQRLNINIVLLAPLIECDLFDFFASPWRLGRA